MVGQQTTVEFPPGRFTELNGSELPLITSPARTSTAWPVSAVRAIVPDLRVAMVALTGFCVFLNVYATQTLLPLLARVFHASKFEVSLTVSATTVAIALAAPAVGLLAERFGRRQTMVASVSLLTLPILLAATSPSLHWLIGWRFAQGLVMPGIIAVTIAYISEEWAAGGAATVMAAYVAGNVLGGVTGRFLSGMVAEHFGWRLSFVALGALNAVGAAAVWRWLPQPRVTVAGGNLRGATRDMFAHLRKPVLLATFAIGMGTLFALVATFTYITFYLAAPPFGLGTAALGSLFLVYLVGVVVTPMCGRCIDRLGHRSAYVAAALASTVGIAMTLSHWLPLVVAGLAVCSTGVFVCQSAATAYLGHISGRAKSSAAGLYSTFYYAGGTLGAAVPALAWSAGGWPACVAMSAAVLLATVGLTLGFWRIVRCTPVRIGQPVDRRVARIAA
jgi:predicted MFS family arabinose efflux permease